MQWQVDTPADRVTLTYQCRNPNSSTLRVESLQSLHDAVTVTQSEPMPRAVPRGQIATMSLVVTANCDYGPPTAPVMRINYESPFWRKAHDDVDLSLLFSSSPGDPSRLCG